MDEKITQTQMNNPAWRWAALAVWALSALAFLALFLIDLRLDYGQILEPCQGVECNWMALSPAEAAVLETWGLSMQAYAALMTGMAVITVAVYWILGGLILVREGATRISLAVSLALLAIPIAMISDTNTVYASYPGLISPSIFLSSLGMIALLLFFYLFPNGRFYPRYASIPFAGSVFLIVIRDIREFIGFGFISPAQTPFFLALVILIAFGLVFQILRYRRASTPLERQQTKWILYGLFVFFLGFPLWLIIFGGLVDMPTGAPGLMMILIGWAVVMITLMALPVTIAIAILRYRLWDIDLIIRKTLIYGALTVLLGLIYFGGVLGLQLMFSSVLNLDSGNVTIVVTTLAIAALFAPLRRRVQNSIDRRFYRRKYNAERVLAEFSETLRDGVNLDELTRSILLVVEETMQPEKVGLWMKEDSAVRRVSEGK